MFARAGDTAKNRQTPTFCLFEVASDQTADCAAKLETLLVATEKVDQSANVPTLVQLAPVIKREG